MFRILSLSRDHIESLSLIIRLPVSLSQRMDLGDCPKIHDLALRADYELASKDKDYYYDIEVS